MSICQALFSKFVQEQNNIQSFEITITPKIKNHGTAIFFI